MILDFSGQLRRQVAAVVGVLALSVTTYGVEEAPQPPLLSFKDGLYSKSPWLNPGKLDFLYRHRPNEDQYNVFGWTPVFKGGGGMLDFHGPGHTDYAGGFVRPLVTHPELGDLILGVHGVDSPSRSDYEFQGEYRFPFGLGLGGGLVRPSVGPDIQFGKVTYRNKVGRMHYILEAQAQEHGIETHPGGYVAVYDEHFMAVGGTDGEQWRTCFGYLGPEEWKFFRPALEVLYVDNSIGNFTGPRSVFANATFRYEGGFLSHAARLGRAMGPQGLEYGNPLGFLAPTWNRRLEVWEMGGLMDFRAEHIHLPNHSTVQRYEGLMFPGQWDGQKNFADHFFVGASYSLNASRETAGLLGGFAGKLGFLKLSLGVDHELDPAVTSIVVGAIDSF